MLEVHRVWPPALTPVTVAVAVRTLVLIFSLVVVFVFVRSLAVRRGVGALRAGPPVKEERQRARAPERKRGDAFPVDQAHEHPTRVNEDVLGREVVVEDHGALRGRIGRAWGKDAREEAHEAGGEGFNVLRFF